MFIALKQLQLAAAIFGALKRPTSLGDHSAIWYEVEHLALAIQRPACAFRGAHDWIREHVETEHSIRLQHGPKIPY